MSRIVGERVGGLRGWLVGVSCVTLGVLIFGVSPGWGFETHVFEASFGADGTSATRFGPEAFEVPNGFAVDEATGDLYVAVGFPGEEIEKFNSAHHEEPFTGNASNIVGGRITGAGGEFWELAVGAPTGALYVANGGPVKAFQSDGEPSEFTAGPGKGTNELPGAEVCGVATDRSGDIYVGEFGVGVHIFAPTGESLKTIEAPGVCDLAVDSSGVVYANVRSGREVVDSGPVERFAPSAPPPVSGSTMYGSPVTVDETGAFAVAVAPGSGDLYVDEGRLVAQYDKAGNLLGTFGSTGVGALGSVTRFGTGMAVSEAAGSLQIYVGQGQGNLAEQAQIFGSDILLPDVTTGAASELNPKGSVTLNGTVNPDGVRVSGCQFAYGPTEAYGKTVACEQNVGEGNTQVAVTAHLSGLEPGVEYHFRLEATNESAPEHLVSTGVDEKFTMPPRPAIKAESIANLTAHTVDLHAEVNPEGSTTTCLFEYGSSIPYEHSVECEAAPGSNMAGMTNVAVERHIEKLEPETTYHWRVVATNDAGTATSVDHTFIYDTSGEGLPDNRAYEMVTPPEKNAALLSVFNLGLNYDVSEDGARLIVSTVQCFAGAESCVVTRGNEVGVPFLFSRESDGWTATGLTPPASSFEVYTPRLVSANTGEELVSMPTPPAGEDDFYVRELDGRLVDIGPVTPPARGAIGPGESTVKRVATVNFSRVVYEEVGIWPSAEGVGVTPYEYPNKYPSGGYQEPALVGVSGGAGSTEVISRCETRVGRDASQVVPGRLSSDGETVFFTAYACEGGTGRNAGRAVRVNELFARVGEAQTVALSEPSAFSKAAPYAGCESESCVKNVNEQGNWKEAIFAGASNDGSHVFFGSEQQLTETATQGEMNLYEAELGEDGSTGKIVVKRLVDISGGDLSGHGARAQGIMASSADGSHVYFVAKGVLTNAANAQGEVAGDGNDNLYVYEGARGRVAFVASLSAADAADWNGEGASAALANVSPDGRFLVFESRAHLTPDDTRIDGARQIFRYDASTGELVRVSTGNRGWNDDGNAGAGNARIVPASATYSHAGAARGDPSMSNDGSFVFFESPIALTPHAVDDVRIGTVEEEGLEMPLFAENVYEWHNGQVSLISDGRDTAKNRNASAVGLIGSDASGSNVFFTTADPLAPQDTDTQVDYYDARICTFDSPCIVPPAPPVAPCLEEACHGVPPAAPVKPRGGSLTLGGTGNVVSTGGTGKKGKHKHKYRHKRKHRHRRGPLTGCRRGRLRGCAGRFGGMRAAGPGVHGRGV